MPVAQTCVCLITRERAGTTELLLGLKKHGLGAGRIVAPGGHIEPGETAPDACAREVFEEVGLAVDPAGLEPAGGLLFLFSATPEWNLHLALYRARRFTGEPAESDELDPAWYPLDDLPWSGMWPDARYWLLRALSGELGEAEITLGPDGETVTNAMFHVEHHA